MKKDITITLTIELDEEEIGKPIRVWLYQFINRLNYEHTIKEVHYGGKVRRFVDREDVRDLALKSRNDL